MQKLFSILLVFAMALSLCACGPAADDSGTTAAAETTETGTGVTVGFGEGNITPDWPIGLSGYGNEATRISTGLKSYIYVHVVAITDAEDETVLIISMDSAGGGLQSIMRPMIEEKFGIPQGNVIVSAIHQHSTPISTEEFKALVLEGTEKAVEQALADRAPAQMYLNTVQTEALSFVRNYVCNDGSYCGDNYGSSASGIKDHESESDKEMRLIKFIREGDKKPIIMVNFQAHPHMGSGGSDTNIHSDWPGVMRETVAEELDAHVMYISGAGGNLNSTSRITSENISQDWRDHGQRAARYVINAEDSYVEATLDDVKVAAVTNTYETDHSMDYLLDIASELHSLRQIDYEASKAAVANYPEIHSIFHASAIVTKAAAGPTYDLTIGAISIGDVAFTYHPYEMFDTNGMELRSGTVGNENYEADEQLENPYEMTFVCTLANGHLGYVPSLLGYTNGGYSTDITKLAPGSGERLVGDYLAILNELHD